MNKKKIIFIVLTVVSLIASVIACALGIPYTPVEVDYDWLEDGFAEAALVKSVETTAAASAILDRTRSRFCTETA